MSDLGCKIKVRKITVVLFMVVFLGSMIFSGKIDILARTKKPLQVFVSIEPQITFVKRIGSERVSVYSLVLPGESPAAFSPTPIQITKLSKSKLYFRIGIPFEESLIQRIRSIAKQVKIVDTRKGIVFRKMKGTHEDEEADTQDPKSPEHEHGGNDPHIWLSPVLVQQQATTICEALISVDPEGRKIYEANLQAFIKDLEVLHQKIKQSLASVRGGTIFVFHPSFGYFADTYGLKQMAVEVEGKRPKGKDLSRFIKQAKKENVRVVFVQPQFDQNAAKKIASAINGAVISLDPLSREYFKNMEAIADKIEISLKK